MRIVERAALTANESQLLTGSRDSTARLWDVETPQQDGDTFVERSDWVRGVATDDVGSRIVSGSEDRTIRVRDAKSAEQVCDPLNGHAVV